jgi:hypothetical protein
MFTFMKVKRKQNNSQFKMLASKYRDKSPTEFRKSASDMRIRTLKPKKHLMAANAVANRLREDSDFNMPYHKENK